MLTVTDADFRRDLGRYQKIASHRPVAITQGGRERCILLSAEEFHRLRKRDREVLAIEDFTEAEVEAVRHACPSLQSEAFDTELTSDA